MNLSVICPACEVEMPVADPQDPQAQCPLCGHSFPLTGASALEVAHPPLAPSETEVIPVPRKLLRRRRPEQPLSTAVAEPAATSPAEAAPVVSETATDDAGRVELDLGSSQRQTKSRWWAFLICAVLMTALGVTIAIQFWPPDRSPQAPESGRAGAMKPVPVSPASPPRDAPPPDDPAEQATAPNESPATVDWNSLQLASREEYYSLWSKVQPHLVSLDVVSPQGTRTIAGVILDSRGFVGTSYQAIRDAIRIDVRLPGRSFVADGASSQLTDQVRGLVVKDEALDLAVLAINRRFISSFSSLRTPDSDAVLPGDRCVATAPPTKSCPTWIIDFPIRQVQPFSRLETAFQSAMSGWNPVTDDPMAWIIGEPSRPLVPGSPIFNFSGELIALVTAADVDSRAAACPARRAFALLANVGKDVQPFPIDAQVAATLKASAEKSEALAQALPDAESPGFELANQLRERLQTWMESPGFPQTLEQYQALRGFAAALLRFDEQLETGQWTDEQFHQARNYLDDTLDQFQSTWVLPDQAVDLSQISRWASDAMGTDDTLVAFADVVRVGVDGRAGTPYVILRLADHDEHLYSAIRFEGPVFLPGSRWLVIGDGRSRVSFRSTDGISIIEARVFEIKYVFAISGTESR